MSIYILFTKFYIYIYKKLKEDQKSLYNPNSNININNFITLLPFQEGILQAPHVL